MERIKVYKVLFKESQEEPNMNSNIEGVFSSYEKAEEYINHFFARADYGFRYIVPTYLDPFEDEIKNNNLFFTISAVKVRKNLLVSVIRTYDPVVKDDLDKLIICESDLNELMMYQMCLASSEEKALEKFIPLINEYKDKHNLTIKMNTDPINDRRYF